jgi:predicted N-acetyltransferase YhbS
MLSLVSESLQVVPCGPERAEDIHLLTQAAFAGYGSLDPPSGALRESVTVVADDLAAGGGAIAELDSRPVGCLRWWLDGRDFRVRRVAVDPMLQGRGIGRALMAWSEAEARRRSCDAVVVGVRIVLVGNLDFYHRLGYEIVAEHAHDGYDRATWYAMRKDL